MESLGQYKLLQRIAIGGMAEIFLAEKPGPAGFSRRLAIKRILPHRADDSEFVEMFLNEARLAAMLNHPNIVRYYTACTFKAGKVLAIVTELLGCSFLTRIREGVSKEEAARWVGQIASALAYMHRLRMQHRDVKPDNVLFDATGQAKLIDVGLACTLGSKSRVSTKAGGWWVQIFICRRRKAVARAMTPKMMFGRWGSCSSVACSVRRSKTWA